MSTRPPAHGNGTASVWLRVLPIPLALGIISIIDRTNIGYASLQMNEAIGLSATAFGFGAGILFLGYFALEIPSNLALKRYGARKWLARIAVSWGLISMATAFVWDEWSFYAMRFLLGLAEAGLFPGVILYLTYWFSKEERGRAVAIFMACIPISTIIGGPLSGWLLGQSGFLGLQGWQLIFIFEGLPAIILGVLTWALLTDSPDTATWLSERQRADLKARLQEEASATPASGHGGVATALRNRHVWLFTVMYFCYACLSYGVAFFLPQILKRLHFSDLQVGLVSALPFALGLVVMILVARSSDRTGERRFHFGVPMVVAGLGLLGAGFTLQVTYLALTFIVVAVCGLMASIATFWPRPTALLTGTAAAAGIAVINSFGNIGGFAGPYVIGLFTDATGGFTAGLVFLTCLGCIGGGLAMAVRARAGDRKKETVS